MADRRSRRDRGTIATNEQTSRSDKITKDRNTNVPRSSQVSVSKWKSLNEVQADVESEEVAVCWNAFSPPTKGQFGEKTPNLTTQNSQTLRNGVVVNETSPSVVLGLATKKKRSNNISKADSKTLRKKGTGSFIRHDSNEEFRSSISNFYGKDKNNQAEAGDNRLSSLPPDSMGSNNTSTGSTAVVVESQDTSDDLFPDDEWDDELAMYTQKAEENWNNSSQDSADQRKEAAIVETPKRASLRSASKSESYLRDNTPQRRHQFSSQRRPANNKITVDNSSSTTTTTTVTNSPTKRKPSPPSVPRKHSNMNTTHDISSNSNNDSVLGSDNNISLFESSQPQINLKNCKSVQPSNNKYRKTVAVVPTRNEAVAVVPTMNKAAKSYQHQHKSKEEQQKVKDSKKKEIQTVTISSCGEFDDGEDDSFLSQLNLNY